MFVRILPPEVRSRIAAGEVIESPADVVKELVENSLDAKATQIEVEISKGGKRLIVVRDNGTGIHPEDMDKVFLEGATSKIESEKDLLNLSSYGFRGEALHAIASVSRLRLSSRYFQEREGYVIEVEGGKLSSKARSGMPVGTQVEVKDLFFNVPARRKFLRKEDTERNKITELLKEYALVNPSVTFRLYSNAKQALYFPGSDEETRVGEVLGGKFEKYQVQVDILKAKVYVRRNVGKGKFYIFVNARPVSSNLLKDFLKRTFGYKTLCVFMLDIPSFLVDFNVHPKKKEVKFLKERKLLSILGDAFGGREVSYVSSLNQDVPAYDTNFRIIGQIEDTIILAQRGDYLYFFDQHLISERINYERMKGDPQAEELSCKASIKAGEPLTHKQMEDLIERWKSLENPHVCPHGRPIYYRIHLKDIYEKLGRSF